jgi:hypothetical protein
MNLVRKERGRGDSLRRKGRVNYPRRTRIYLRNWEVDILRMEDLRERTKEFLSSRRAGNLRWEHLSEKRDYRDRRDLPKG